MQDQRRSVLQRTPAILGFLLLVGGSESRAQIPVAGDYREFKVMTYNIQGLPGPAIDQGKYEKIGRWLESKAKDGDAPDLIVFQEAFHSNATRDLPRFSKYPFGARGPGSRPLRINSGLLVLSRFRLTQYDEMHYQACAGTDCLSSKGIQRAVLNLPFSDGTTVAVEFFNTHLNADNDAVSTNEQSQAARFEQLREIFRKFLPRRPFAQMPTFFLGDFNFMRGDRDYEWVKEQLGTGSHEETFPELTPGLDHLFLVPSRNNRNVQIQAVSARTRFDGVDGPILSDHVAIEIKYRIFRPALRTARSLSTNR